MTSLRALSVAMFKGFVRDRGNLFWMVLFPLMFLVLFGGIFTGGGASRVEMLQYGSVAIIDDVPEVARESIEEALELTSVDDLDAAIEQVREGDADAVIAQVGDEVQLWFSQADQVRAGQTVGTIQGLVDSTNLAVTGVAPTYSLVVEQVEDDSLEAIQYITPGILGWAVAMSAIFGSALNLVAWRKNGLLRRLRLSPIPTRTVVLARVGVSLVVAMVQAAIFIGVAVGFFGLQLSGWWLLVVPLIIVGTLAFLSIGLLAGAVAKTEEGAANLANGIVLPMAFLSGSFFPLDGSPDWLQTVSKLLPLRYLNDGLLDVMVRGAGPAATIVPIAVMLGFAIAATSIAAKMFRWDA